MAHTSRTQGPAATTSCSQRIVPVSVSTAVTASHSKRRPVTATGDRMRAPAAWALPASPSMDGMFSA
jgi:hypothetical protein